MEFINMTITQCIIGSILWIALGIFIGATCFLPINEEEDESGDPMEPIIKKLAYLLDESNLAIFYMRKEEDKWIAGAGTKENWEKLKNQEE